jgi:tyrosyl-tRNA synthetase
MEGTDGRKMSSSWGNVINLTDKPADMYGKVMGVGDELIGKYFLLATQLPENDIKDLSKSPPYDQKRRLAFEVTKLYHGEKKAQAAADGFTKQFTKGEIPSDMPTKKLSGNHQLPNLLVELGLVSSGSEARRIIIQGGVKVDGSTQKDEKAIVTVKTGMVVQVGKRKFVKII